MKKILFILIVAISLQCYSQEWSPIGAKWQFSINVFWITGYLEIECVGDTVINNTSYRVLNKVYHLYNYLNQTYYIDTIGQEFTYQDGEKVYILRNNQLYTLFDFGAQVGDWWVIPHTYSAGEECDTVGYVQVDSVGTANINGIDLKQIYISPLNESDWGWGAHGIDVLTEKIGSQYLYLFPEIISFCIADVFEGGLFRCYEDEEIGLYSVLTYGYCDSIHTGITEFRQEDVVSVYPNPFTTSTTIEYELKEPSHVQLTIYNAIGETIYVAEEGILPQGKHTLIWTDDRLPEGLYYIVLRSEEGVSVVKMIKQ